MPLKTEPADSASQSAYTRAGVDTSEADAGLSSLKERFQSGWLSRETFGAPQLDIGYFANVVNIGGGTGLAICVDGVGSKAKIAHELKRYDTIGIDCVAMNVNDLICVGARPVSFVDYIGVQAITREMIDQISVGLTRGVSDCKVEGFNICGGEIAQLKEIINGFDLIGTAVGTVPLDRIVTGKNLRPGDVVIGLASNGIHSNGLSLARRTFLEDNEFRLDHRFEEIEGTLGDELLRPTEIYVPEVLDVIATIPETKALINVTSDGLLNLTRVDAPVGFVIDNLPKPQPIFDLIERFGAVDFAEMFHVYNMGVGFCVVVAKDAVDRTLEVLHRHKRRAWPIGHAVADAGKHVEISQHGLIGQGKFFRKR